MSSELSGASADRPDRPVRGDRGDWSPEDDPGPDVTPVPASADYRAPGITRAEAYAAVGQADQTPNAFLLRRDASSRDEGVGGIDGSGDDGPDRERAQPQSREREAAPEAAPDARAGDDRLSPAMEQRVNAMVEQRMQAVTADLEARHKAESDSLRAENAEVRAENADLKAENAEIKTENAEIRAENAEIRQQLDETNAKLGDTNAKLDDQGSKLDAILAALGPGAADTATSRQETGEPEDQDKADADQRDRQPSPDRSQDEGRDRPGPPERPDKPTATKPDQRNDALGTGDDEATDEASSTGEGSVDQRWAAEPGVEGHKGPAKSIRRFFTAENIKTTAGSVGTAVTGTSLYQVVAGHLPSEVAIPVAVAAFGAQMVMDPLIRKVYKKWKG
ncbi:MAG: hypothetical protein J2P25_01055 [Nocardiopsaceae bacterium]|nr:hypothetical protein [Nocardiopsaceae bacterium]